jgi:hypothetical protein
MRVERDPVRAHDRDRLAATPARARLRLRHDLLASPARLATGRRLATAARTAARPAPPRRAARPLACRLRLRLAAGAFGGSKTGPSPVDRRKAGSKHHLITAPTVSRSPACSPAPTATTSPSCCRSSRRSHPCVASAGDHAADPTHSSPTAARTPSHTDRRYAPAGSDRSSPNATPSTHPISAANAGSSSAPSPGSTSTGASDSATNAAPTSTKHSSASRAASSASDSSAAHCVDVLRCEVALESSSCRGVFRGARTFPVGRGPGGEPNA